MCVVAIRRVRTSTAAIVKEKAAAATATAAFITQLGQDRESVPPSANSGLNI